MSLVTTGELARQAQQNAVGLGAFNVIMIEHAEAIVAGAIEAGRPVVLQLSQNTILYHGSLAPLAAALVTLARAAPVPVAVHLDHATERPLVEEAIDMGFTSVMFDASILPYDQNVQATAEVARHCHAAGVTIEAELGEVGGKDGAHTPGFRTDPDQANGFVNATGVDLLAVAVGTTHAMQSQTATVDTDLVARLHTAVEVPLVLHGSSGVPDHDLPQAVAAGLTKVNLATTLNVALTQAVRTALTADPKMSDPRQWMTPARQAVTQRVVTLLTTLATTAPCTQR